MKNRNKLIKLIDYNLKQYKSLYFFQIIDLVQLLQSFLVK